MKKKKKKIGQEREAYLPGALLIQSNANAS